MTYLDDCIIRALNLLYSSKNPGMAFSYLQSELMAKDETQHLAANPQKIAVGISLSLDENETHMAYHICEYGDKTKRYYMDHINRNEDLSARFQMEKSHFVSDPHVSGRFN